MRLSTLVFIALFICSCKSGSGPGVSQSAEGGTQNNPGEIISSSGYNYYGKYSPDSSCESTLESYIEKDVNTGNFKLSTIDCSDQSVSTNDLNTSEVLVLERNGGIIVYDGSIFEYIGSDLNDATEPDEEVLLYCFTDESTDDYEYYRLILRSKGDPSIDNSVQINSGGYHPIDGKLYHHEGKRSGENTLNLSGNDFTIDYSRVLDNVLYVSAMVVHLDTVYDENYYNATFNLVDNQYPVTCVMNKEFNP